MVAGSIGFGVLLDQVELGAVGVGCVKMLHPVLAHDERLYRILLLRTTL
jgi:hypothetical protein